MNWRHIERDNAQAVTRADSFSRQLGQGMYEAGAHIEQVVNHYSTEDMVSTSISFLSTSCFAYVHEFLQKLTSARGYLRDVRIVANAALRKRTRVLEEAEFSLDELRSLVINPLVAEDVRMICLDRLCEVSFDQAEPILKTVVEGCYFMSHPKKKHSYSGAARKRAQKHLAAGEKIRDLNAVFKQFNE